MRSLFKLTIFVLLIFFIWNVYQHKFNQSAVQETLDKIAVEIDSFPFASIVESAESTITQLLQMVETKEENISSTDTKQTEKTQTAPTLSTPADDDFSVNNIQIGDTKSKAEGQLKQKQRSVQNEYGVNWNIHHENYQQFVMVSYDKSNKVSALYTNQPLISSKIGVSYGSAKKDVEAKLGKPLTELLKGNVYYQFGKDRDFDTFLKDNQYITIFYDKHKNNTVTAIQIVSKSLEDKRADYYTKESTKLREGLELTLFDLTNSSRVVNNLSPLTWDNKVQSTARKHSKDMALHNYFDHTNLEGESPFDRMLKDGISYTLAGENLAYGQYSSIFAHEGLMNSLGHRKNILQKDFKELGVGVAFNNEAHPYYTENYYTK